MFNQFAQKAREALEKQQAAFAELSSTANNKSAPALVSRATPTAALEVSTAAAVASATSNLKQSAAAAADDDTDDLDKVQSAVDLAEMNSSSAPQTGRSSLASTSTSPQIQAIKAYQIERAQLERVIREITPLDGLSDLHALEVHLKGLLDQKNASKEEIKRLVGDLEVQKKDGSAAKQQLAQLKDEALTRTETFRAMQEQLMQREEVIDRLRKVFVAYR